MTFHIDEFRLRHQLAGGRAEEDPADTVLVQLNVDRNAKLYARVPLSLAGHLSASGRLILLLCFLQRARSTAAVDGMWKLSPSTCGLVGLDREQRKRALKQLERAGIVEVRRQRGKSPMARLALPPIAAAA